MLKIISLSDFKEMFVVEKVMQGVKLRSLKFDQ